MECVSLPDLFLVLPSQRKAHLLSPEGVQTVFVALRFKFGRWKRKESEILTEIRSRQPTSGHFAHLKWVIFDILR